MIDYGKVAPYYDRIQRDMLNYHEDAERIHNLFREYKVETVLDLACGTGSHVLALSEFGYRCVGLDFSSEMLAVARKKAEKSQCPVEFFEGDLLNYQLGRTFDAVLGIYALGNLISDEAFRSALVSVRKAVKDNGLFLMNLFNAEQHGMEMMRAMGPMFFMDAMINEPDLRLVRFNQVSVTGDIQTWAVTYLVDEGQGVKMVAGAEQFRFHYLDWIKKELSIVGFEFQSVTYHSVQNSPDFDMFVLAQAKTS
jgi:SAM-dependent methyltransferase